MRNRNGSGSAPRITKRLEAALTALVDGRATTCAEAADAAGLSRRAVEMALKKPHVEQWIETRIRSGFRTTSIIAAARRMNSLIGAKSEYIQFEASRHVLALAGVKPSADASPGRGGLVVNLHLAGTHQSALLDALAGGGRVIDAKPLPVAADE